MEYIHRDLEKKIKELAEDYSCILITGPRQVGKTTLFKKLMDENRTVVSLDDLEERKLAQTDPAMFLQMHDLPILIDEVQYAPQLFPYIKMAIDNGAPASSFWLTGSQAFRMMELVAIPTALRTSCELKLEIPAKSSIARTGTACILIILFVSSFQILDYQFNFTTLYW